MMKLFAVSALALGLAACGGGGGESEDDSSTQVESTQVDLIGTWSIDTTYSNCPNMTETGSIELNSFQGVLNNIDTIQTYPTNIIDPFTCSYYSASPETTDLFFTWNNPASVRSLENDFELFYKNSIEDLKNVEIVFSDFSNNLISYQAKLTGNNDLIIIENSKLTR